MSRPPLVLLHGWGLHPVVWTPLIEALEGRFQIHAPPLPGHGGAPEAGDALDDWVEALLADAPPRAPWVGWSLGGLVALRARRLAPERVSAFIGLATTPCFTRRPDWPRAMDGSLLARFAAQLEEERAATLERFLALQFHGVAGGRQLLRRLRRWLDEQPPPRPRALRQGLALLRDTDLRPVTEASCWLFGALDRLVPPDLPLAPPARRRVIAGAGHAPFLSHPATVARHLLEALRHD